MLERALSFLGKPIVKLATSLMILAALMIWLPFAELKQSLTAISLSAWLLVFAGYLGGHILGVVKWNLMISLDGHKMPFWVAARCYFAGLFSNLFLPSLAGGDIVKTGLAIGYKKSKSSPIFGTLIDRIIDTVSVVFIILAAALFSPRFLQPQDQLILYLFIAAISVLILFTLILIAVPVERFREGKLRAIMERAQRMIREIRDKPARPITCFFLSLLIQSLFIFLTVYLAMAIGIVLPLVLWFLVWPLAKLSALLPVSLGGIGVREVALAVLLGRLAIPMTDAVALGLLWNSLLISGSIIGGLLYIGLRYLPGGELPAIASILQYKTQTEKDTESKK